MFLIKQAACKWGRWFGPIHTLTFPPVCHSLLVLHRWTSVLRTFWLRIYCTNKTVQIYFLIFIAMVDYNLKRNLITKWMLWWQNVLCGSLKENICFVRRISEDDNGFFYLFPLSFYFITFLSCFITHYLLHLYLSNFPLHCSTRKAI